MKLITANTKYIHEHNEFRSLPSKFLEQMNAGDLILLTDKMATYIKNIFNVVKILRTPHYYNVTC